MDMHFQEMNSTVRVTDSREIDRIVNAVLARLREQQGSEQRRQEDTRIGGTAGSPDGSRS